MGYWPAIIVNPDESVSLRQSPPAGDSSLEVATTAFVQQAISAGVVHGCLIRVLVITATGIYTASSGAKSLYVECVGGGGAGAGAVGTASNCSCGGGGGAGGYAAALVPAGSYAVTVGAAGAGGSGSGSNGGQTSLGSAVIVLGGQGASTLATGTALGVAFGGFGGAASSGDLQTSGGPGQNGVRLSGTAGFGGMGGNSFFNGAGRGCLYASGAGINALSYGGGGGGACAVDGNTYAGGNGAQGVIRVWEFT